MCLKRTSVNLILQSDWLIGKRICSTVHCIVTILVSIKYCIPHRNLAACLHTRTGLEPLLNRNKKVVNKMVSNVWHDLPISRNQPLKSAED